MHNIYAFNAMNAPNIVMNVSKILTVLMVSPSALANKRDIAGAQLNNVHPNPTVKNLNTVCCKSSSIFVPKNEANNNFILLFLGTLFLIFIKSILTKGIKIISEPNNLNSEDCNGFKSELDSTSLAKIAASTVHRTDIIAYKNP